MAEASGRGGAGGARRTGRAAGAATTRKSSKAAATPAVRVPGDRVAVVQGDDDFLVQRTVAELVATLRSRDPALEVTDVTAADCTPGLLAEVASPSLFGGDRLLVVRQLRDADESLAAAVVALFADLPTDLRCIVSDVAGSAGRRDPAASGPGTAAGKALAATLVRSGATHRSCTAPGNARERVAFVKDEFVAAGATITTDAAQLLVEVVGSDTRELASATAQLVADLGEPGKRLNVQAGDVERFHRGRAEVTGFAIADLVLAGDAEGAAEHLRRAAVLGVHPLLVADALASGLRTLLRVAAAVGDRPAGPAIADAVAKEVKVPAWKVRRLAGVGQEWTQAGLVASMRVAAELNAGLKGAGTVADEQFALERAVSEVLAQRGRRR